MAGSLAISGAGLGASFSFGGDGGVGGVGMEVKVTSNGDIMTAGPGSTGILAQSIGGGGGNGGFSGQIALSNGAAYGNAVGGTGGSGNFAGNVTVKSTGTISTSQDNSIGIIAQSIGGGGGNGGFTISGSGTLGDTSVGAAKSGDGGSSGTGGIVDVTSTGLISTQGNLSYGILAQSVGGGGGNGGFAISVQLSESGDTSGNAVGGRGGDGNLAQGVTVTTNQRPDVTGTNVISTTGIGAIGILAQSIGGGGGNGGFAINAQGSLDGDSGTKNSLGGTQKKDGSVGGDAGNGSKGGTVTVNNNGTITTTNMDAHGIVAQSIGGGGGTGGFSIAAGFSNAGDATANSIGGKGGNGGDGDTVKVVNKGNIFVGAAFVFDADGLPIDPNTTDPKTPTAVASGIIAQSIGGGGGTGGFSLAAGVSLNGEAATNSIGGAGGKGGQGGVVAVTNDNVILVGGPNSSGIIAQSVGGGGGTGGFTILAGVTIGDSKDSKNTIGGSGGAGGDGGKANTVNVTTSASSAIMTFGDNDTGITAQSIGGGGGSGGFSIAAGFTMGGNTTSSVGGSCGDGCHTPPPDGTDPNAPNMNAGGGGGASNTVTVDNSGTIITRGMNSTGIVAQSIGGGGGTGGFAIGAAFSVDGGATTNAVGGNGGNGGDGGQVFVTERAGAVIDIQGKNSTGILAQSIGGGGGTGGFAIAGDADLSKKDVVSNTLGGSGGQGGKGMAVTVTTEANSSITTHDVMSQGIVAQSIGGGGGTGGFGIAGTFSTDGNAKSSVGGSCDADCADKTASAANNNNPRSTGGGGGDGGLVTVDNAGSITTLLGSSIGIVAQSIGGGGGTGGFAATGAVTLGGAGANNSVGGQGGDGGMGVAVKVTNEALGTITTNGPKSIGILAQSIGGGGGDGGFAVGLNVNNGGSSGDSDSTVHGATTGVGGNGGKGGAGGTVTVINDGKITTNGAMSTGIIAQSIGGGGGTGGITVTGTLEMGGGGMTNSAGGSCDMTCKNQAGGGGGGDAKLVTVTNSGEINVQGSNSIGIIAQSIGGGGGSAGFAANAMIGGGALSNNAGGNGGDGGNGGNVVVTNTGKITTFGANSIGILAQSIGGGGGNAALSLDATTGGGAASADLRVGGLQTGGGTGGTAGTVTVDVSEGMIQTNGAMSYGVLAQAINGGGGNSVLAALGLNIPGDPTTTVGGINGLARSDATDSSMTIGSAVIMMGSASFGQAVQSIGGGGGTGGIAVDNFGGGGTPFNLIIGGSGAFGGDGGVATYKNSGNITTMGDNAAAAIVQSIGGGGGWGEYTFKTVSGDGNTVSTIVGGQEGGTSIGKKVDVPTFSGTVLTKGILSEGLIAQSIGGGGGIGTFVTASGINVASSNGVDGLELKVGGQGGGGGNGGAVSIAATGAITTMGVGSIGIVAQSIGGGGGVAQTFGVSAAGTYTLGGASGVAGDSDLVTVSSSQLISTAGAGAHGILAQAIGGGGGLIQAFGPGGAPVYEQITAGGGGSGTGMAVSVTATGAVKTTGDGAFGIIAQSIGGGGGLVGGGAFANALGTTGPFAGSVGGAGGAGTVKVNAFADVTATGLGSTAIYAQSAASSGFGSNIDVMLGTAVTGTTQLVSGGANALDTTNAISIVGGATNTLTSFALLTTSGGINGMTVTGGVGNEAVTSFGHMIGSVNLGSGTNSLDIKPYNSNPSTSAGVFDSGTTVNLGAGNLLTVEGVISPGAFLKVLQTNETGNYLQTAPGSCGTFGVATSTCGYYGLDLDLRNILADRINVTGTASVAGAVDVNINNPGSATPGTSTITILSAAGGETHSNLVLQAQPTAVATYALTFPNFTDIDLQTTIDFSPKGLTQNQHAVGNAINAIQTAHIPAFEPIAAALFYQPTAAALGAVYNSLSGEGVATLEQASFTSNDLFHTSIVNQARFWMGDNEGDNVNGLTYYDGAPLGYAAAARQNTFPDDALRQANAADLSPRPAPQRTWRAWTTFNGGSWKFPGDGLVGSASSSVSGAGFASGIDYQLTPGFIMGAAIGYGRQTFAVTDRATAGTGDGAHAALYAAARGTNAYAVASVGGDYFNNTEGRTAFVPGTVLPPLFGMQIPPIPGFLEHLTGAFNSYSVSGRFETGYKYFLGGGYSVTPLGGVSFASLWTNGFNETNSGGNSSTIGLSFADRNIISIPGFIGAQLDARQSLANGGSLSGWLRAEWVHEFDPHRTVNPAFLAAPAFGFVIEGAEAPIDLARVTLGGKVAIDKNVSVTADLRADIYRTPSYSGWTSLRVSW